MHFFCYVQLCIYTFLCYIPGHCYTIIIIIIPVIMCYEQNFLTVSSGWVSAYIQYTNTCSKGCSRFSCSTTHIRIEYVAEWNVSFLTKNECVKCMQLKSKVKNHQKITLKYLSIYNVVDFVHTENSIHAKCHWEHQK